jgi:homoserine dehydrogenase
MTTVLNDVAAQAAPSFRPDDQREIRVALLGLGHVGSAVAATAAAHKDSGSRFTITTAVVRDVRRPRAVDTSRFILTTDPSEALATNPDIVVEVLGGIEPARTAILAALAAKIPVVTANKSLLAAHGDELFAAAARAGVPLLYEASVLAGVPFLSTFRRRPLARTVTGIQGILNGTSNFILSRMARDGADFSAALANAQRLGYAEPDPSKDVDGDDAVEKLCVLLRHFGDFSVAPSRIEQRGIRDVGPADLQHAAAFGGTIRPVAVASWRDATVTAYGGPAFVESTHQLCRVDGVQNAVVLTTPLADGLFFSGPGAGPSVTAATVLDDVVEAIRTGVEPDVRQPRLCDVVRQAESGWFVRLTSTALGEQEAPALLASLGVRLRRTSHVDARSGRHHQWILTGPCGRAHLIAALAVLEARTGSQSWFIPGVD